MAKGNSCSTEMLLFLLLLCAYITSFLMFCCFRGESTILSKVDLETVERAFVGVDVFLVLCLW